MLIGKQFTEKLYSTGDEMLDNLLERAFCEGYELAQREFNNSIVGEKLTKISSDYNRRIVNDFKNPSDYIKVGDFKRAMAAGRPGEASQINKGIFGKLGGIFQKINTRGANKINKGY